MSEAAVGTSAASPTWTPDQWDAIRADGVSLLVSAAAGSGKTAVLAARCVRLVDGSIDGEPGPADDPRVEFEPCSVESLLVVTFTNAAARQMRDRIGRRLRERLEQHEAANNKAAARLRRELALLPRASISTLSSFCSSVLRRHFHAAGVDPGFAVLDADQSNLLKRQAARELFDAHYEADDNAAFRRLVDLYADGFDARLIDRMIACDAFLTSVAEPGDWKRDALARVREAAERPLGESELGRQWVAVLGDLFGKLGDLAAAAEDVTRGAAARDAKLRGVAAYASGLADEARRWQTLVEDAKLAALAERVRDFDAGRKPAVARDHPAKEVVDAAITGLREAMTKGDAAALLAFEEKDWQAGMAAVVEPTEQFLSLVNEFGRRYAARKAAIRALDFADLERKTLDLLSANGGADALRPSEIALHYQRQFRHVLVDEFQDINEVQERLLRLLSRETAPPEGLGGDGRARPNLFCVGDVKQSIYRFRLAEPHQFLRRQREIAEGKLAAARTIDLQTNFRSRGPLLASINAAFLRLMSDAGRLEIDYAERHQLNVNERYPPAEPAGFGGGPVEVHVLEPVGAGADGDDAAQDVDDAEHAEARDAPEAEADRIEREAAVVAARIKQFKDEGRVVLNERGQTEPFDFKHAAVLLRSMRMQSERFARVLRRMGVPCHSEVGTGFFTSTEVRDVLSLLHLLDNRRQDIPLAAVLRSPLVDLPEAEEVLARVRVAYRSDAMAFFEAVTRYAREQDDGVAARLRYVLATLDDYRRLAHRRPLAELVWHVYVESGYLAYVAGLHDGEQRVANLLELHRRAGQFDTFNRQGLGAFMAFLQSLEEAGEVGQPPVVSEADNVVRVMSVHASKGLEFPVVFLADCGKRHNTTEGSDAILLERTVGVAMQAVDELKQVRYPTLAHEIARRRIRRASLAEELRVLYVAMTRAREHLVCVGTVKLRKGQGAADVVGRWEAFAGVDRLDAADVLKADSFLDWLGMAAAGRAEHFDLQIVPAATADDLVRGVSGRSKPAAVDPRLCDLSPLPDAPPLDGPARAAVERLTTPYGFEAFTRLPAALGVTTVARQAESVLPSKSSASRGNAAPEPFQPRGAAITQLAPPVCIALDIEPTASEIGTATHVVLRHLDFRDAAAEADVRRQIDLMVERKQVAAPVARRVDAASLAWLAGSDLGTLLKQHHDVLLRELPVRLGADPADLVPGWTATPPGDPPDSLDRVLLRGQVDVAIPLGVGVQSSLVLADYKTDRLPPGDAEAGGRLIDAYRSQLVLYRQAVERIAGRPVTAAYLVLLSARRVERL